MRVEHKSPERHQDRLCQLTSGVLLPERLSATVAPETGDDLPYAVELDIVLVSGRYRVAALTLRQITDGPPITSAGLRDISINDLILHAVAPLALDSKDLKPPVHGPAAFADAGPADVADGPTDRALQKVAAVYQLSYACGLRPAKTVTETFGLSRSTAGRWITMARQRGFLGPTTRGRAGEHQWTLADGSVWCRSTLHELFMQFV
jgi:hypothetical protein